MPAFRLALAALLAALAAAPAQAEILGWRYISSDLQAATSTCIGSNESPVCAAETIIACTVALKVERLITGSLVTEHYPEICEAADAIGMDTLPLYYTPRGPSPRARGIYLYLLDVWSVAEDSSEEYRHGADGDVVVDIYTGTCAEETDHPRACAGLPFQDQQRTGLCQDPDPSGFLVPEGSLVFRQRTDGWRLTDFRSAWTDAEYRYCFRSRPERWRRDASDLLRYGVGIR